MEQKECSVWRIVYRNGTVLYCTTREGSCRRCATQMAAAVAATSPAKPTSSAHRCPLFDFQWPRPKCDRCLCGGRVGGRGASIQTGRPTRTSVRVRTWCLLTSVCVRARLPDYLLRRGEAARSALVVSRVGRWTSVVSAAAVGGGGGGGCGGLGSCAPHRLPLGHESGARATGAVEHGGGHVGPGGPAGQGQG